MSERHKLEESMVLMPSVNGVNWVGRPSSKPMRRAELPYTAREKERVRDNIPAFSNQNLFGSVMSLYYWAILFPKPIDKYLLIVYNHSMKVDIKKLNCKRCGHTWCPRQSEVRLCPKCKSPYWDRAKKVKRFYS